MPQSKRSLALIYAVNPFGADHQSSEHDPYYEEDCARFNTDRLAEIDLKDVTAFRSLGPEKVRFAAYTEMFYSMLDSAELCQFVFGPTWTLYGPRETVEMVQAVTGWDFSLYELMKVGERRLNLMRVFNAREGFTRQDDRLPKKFYSPWLAAVRQRASPWIHRRSKTRWTCITRSWAGPPTAALLRPNWMN